MGKWFAAVGLCACAAVPILAQSSNGEVTAPPGVDHAVRSRLAREWGVDASRLVLTYGRFPDSITGAAVTDVRYARRGGRLMITYELVTGEEMTTSGRAGVLVRVPVATRLMLPGDTLDQDAFRWEDRASWGPPPAGGDSASSGYLVRGRIVAGQRITRTVAIPPPAIRAGSWITLRWSDAALSLEMNGLALGTGYPGQTIPVRLRGDGDRVMATIIGPATAQLRER